MDESVRDDEVGEILRQMLAAGSVPPPRVTASELRQRAERRMLPRIDTKAIVIGVAAVVLIVVLFTAGPLRHSRTVDAPGGGKKGALVAHSAYGLQITVPTSWSVQVFGSCPGRGPGTLFIGTSQFVDSCPAFGLSQDIVSMSKGNSAAAPAITQGPQYRIIQVHGLTVLASSASQANATTGGDWYLPSKRVTITGTGPSALAIMRTLAPATSEAIPATGFVSGTEHLHALAVVPGSGPVDILTPHSKKVQTVTVLNGLFSFTAAPGRYVLRGHDGDAACPQVKVTVVSAERVTAPAIVCQGS